MNNKGGRQVRCRDSVKSGPAHPDRVEELWRPGVETDKIIAYQNNGDVTRIRTYEMAPQFEAYLEQLKNASGF